jgi:serine protease Do
MISDVLPDSPAEAAGLRPRDIITAVDGAAISALPYYTAMMYLHDPTIPVAVAALRGDRTLRFQVPAVTADDQYLKGLSIDPIDGFIPELGIFGTSVSSTPILRNGVRSDTGIYVVATTSGNSDGGTELAPGDVIASLNGAPLRSVRELRGALHELPDGRPAVLQIERIGQFIYIEKEVDKRLPESGMAPIDRH